MLTSEKLMGCNCNWVYDVETKNILQAIRNVVFIISIVFQKFVNREYKSYLGRIFNRQVRCFGRKVARIIPSVFTSEASDLAVKPKYGVFNSRFFPKLGLTKVCSLRSCIFFAPNQTCLWVQVYYMNTILLPVFGMK